MLISLQNRINEVQPMFENLDGKIHSDNDRIIINFNLRGHNLREENYLIKIGHLCNFPYMIMEENKGYNLEKLDHSDLEFLRISLDKLKEGRFFEIHLNDVDILVERNKNVLGLCYSYSKKH